MAQIPNSIETIISKYRNQLTQAGINCEEILCYGSRIHGTATEGSDIDLIVISRDWQRYSLRERLELLGIAAAHILEPIQAIGFTPQEIEQQDILPFWQDIMKNALKAA